MHTGVPHVHQHLYARTHPPTGPTCFHVASTTFLSHTQACLGLNTRTHVPSISARTFHRTTCPHLLPRGVHQLHRLRHLHEAQLTHGSGGTQPANDLGGHKGHHLRTHVDKHVMVKPCGGDERAWELDYEAHGANQWKPSFSATPACDHPPIPFLVLPPSGAIAA